MGHQANGQQPVTGVEELGFDLAAAVGRVYRRFRSERAGGDLGDAAMGVLVWLYNQGPQTLTALSEHDRVTPASMSQVVNRLTSAGYAVRGWHPEAGRGYLCTGPPVGSALAQETGGGGYGWFNAPLQEGGPAD
ncbi:MAG: MarR family winged helix-turn-helix transcriptional regulator, partial [Oryzihumus sp.]